MTITLVLVLISILALVLFTLLAARGRGPVVSDISQLQGRTRPVDLLAFRNLTSPLEEQFLRDHLTAADFRSIQRQRLRAAFDYLDCVSGNAAVLLRLGEAARRSPDPKVADAGLQLANNALRLRLYALPLRARFGVAYLFPGMHISPTPISDLYEQLTGTVSRIGYLQTGAIHRTAAIL